MALGGTGLTDLQLENEVETDGKVESNFVDVREHPLITNPNEELCDDTATNEAMEIDRAEKRVSARLAALAAARL